MSDHDHALALLTMAEKDLRALGGMTDADTFADEIVGFHAQQAVEKAMKAWLAERSVAYPLTHDLSVLLGLLDDAGEEAAPFRSLVRLNVFAVRFRYEALGMGTPLDNRAAATAEVQALIEHVRSVLDP
jgi:HEPN domain-containing protein